MKPYELFEVLAGKTWRSIDRFSRNKIHLGEDAITSINLDALASAAPTCVLLEDTRAQESSKGCDFELWIGSAHLGWKRYAVQAKKIQPSSSRYAMLNHAVGGTLQIDILEKYAGANRAVPVYCLYNYSTKSYAWNCNLRPEAEQLGCSVTPSSVIRTAIATHGARNFTYVHSQPATLPWRCLMRCPEFISKAAKGHEGWPALDEFSYDSLPAPLMRFKNSTGPISFEDQPGLFNSNLQLRPGWIGIVDLAFERRGG